MVDLMTRRLTEQLKAQGIGLELTPEAKEHLAEKGYDPTLGARPLRRSIQRLIEDPLSEKLLWKEFSPGQTIVVDLVDGELSFRAVDPIAEPPAEELVGGGESPTPGEG
jgi:ATP-dependent Clp protease ATP-binding subunit ClpC